MTFDALIIRNALAMGDVRSPIVLAAFARERAHMTKRDSARLAPHETRKSQRAARRDRMARRDPREVAARSLGLTPKGEAAMFGHL